MLLLLNKISGRARILTSQTDAPLQLNLQTKRQAFHLLKRR